MSELVPSQQPVNIEDEMKRSYMDYAMSVIIGRALPDARDGLKPAHRRVLYGMKTMGLSSTRTISRFDGSIVVSQSCSGFISPRPL